MVIGGDLLGPAEVPVAKVVAAGLWIAAVASARETRARPPTSLLALVGLVALCALSLAWTVDREASWRVVRHLLQEGALVAALVIAPRRERLLQALAVGAAAGAGLLAVGLLSTWAVGEAQARRLVVGDGDSGHQARQLVVGGLLALAAIRRWPGLALAAGIGVGLGLTGSRGAWLAWAAALLLALAWPAGPHARRGFALGLAGIVVGALLLGARADVRPVIPHADRQKIVSGREVIWANTLAMAADHPVAGVGVGAAQSLYEDYRAERVAAGGADTEHHLDPHSLYLGLLAEVGPLGLALLLLALALIARDLRAAGRRDAAGLVLGVAVGAATVSPLEQKAFWLGLVWAALAATAPPPSAD